MKRIFNHPTFAAILLSIICMSCLPIRSKAAEGQEKLFQQSDAATAFQQFLANFKKTDKFSKDVFGQQTIGNNVLDIKKSDTYLPEKENDCLCDEGDIFWQSDASYMVGGKFTLLFIKRHCGAYKDANEKYFMENLVTDHMLITYTHDGKIIDSKSLGRDGSSFILDFSLTAPLTFVCEEGYIDDALQMFHSKELTYTMTRSKIAVNEDGKITTEKVGEPWKKNVRNLRPISLEPETVIRELKWFYKACMTDGIDMNNLYDKYLTKSMREKMHRLTQVTNSDILLRAQDFSDYGRESVSVKHLDWYWYEVSYQFSPTAKPERIPVRIDDALEDVRILYVVPEWGDTAYGDSLLITDNVRIEDEDADTFIRTFYQKYTNLYIEMPETLQEDLQQLRQRHCTDNFLRFYNSIKTELQIEYAQDAYDAVIDNYDFDAFWRSSLKIENIAPLRYKVTYAPDNALIVTLKQTDGTYKIDSVNTRMEEVLKEARHP